MIDITASHPYPLEPGETVYEMESGRRFVLITIHDDQHSHQTQEIFHFVATLIDQNGQPVVRSDGKIARDLMGHSMTHHSQSADLLTTLAEAREHYLQSQDRAAQAHDDIGQMNIVKKSAAAYSPVRVTPDKRDRHGRPLHS